LLIRCGPRGSQLTEDGVVVAEWAARLLEVAAEFDAGLATLRQDHRRRLRVSASLTMAEAAGRLAGGLAAAAHRDG
jgi:DNA-binding transcriptional LysR family regulator